MLTKSRKLLPPYNGYYSCGPTINKKDFRYILSLKNDSGKTVSSTSYARYLMSVKLGRLLHKEDEQVDHIDGDPTNNTYENLQIITKEENLKKYSETIRGRLLKFNCASCGVTITRKDDYKDPTKTIKVCSRSCHFNCLKMLKNMTREGLIAKNNSVIIEAIKPEIIKKFILEDFNNVSLPI